MQPKRTSRSDVHGSRWKGGEILQMDKYGRKVIKGIQEEWKGVEEGMDDEDQRGEGEGGAGEGEGRLASGRIALTRVL